MAINKNTATWSQWAKRPPGRPTTTFLARSVHANSPGVQTIPLVLAGPGVHAGKRSQAAARLIDVAPTILKVMGLPPSDMDGIPLADALVDPPADAVHAQTTIDAGLGPHRDALRDRAERDLWEDRHARLAPPPSLPPQP